MSSYLRVGRPERKWYHVVWRTHRRRPLFKIPAAARFCERELRRLLVAHGWTAEAVYVGPRELHVLVQPPLNASRAAIVRELKRQAATAARTAGSVPPGRSPLWHDGAWCVALSSGPQLAATRRWLARRIGPVRLG